MKKPEYYPKAIAPESLTGARFKNLTVEAPVYLGEIDEDVYATTTGEVRVRLSTELTREERNPKSVLGRAGLMRVLLSSPSEGEDAPHTLRPAVVADFRYLQEPLSQYEAEAPTDQESLNEWVVVQNDSVKIDAFMMKEDGKTLYCGPEEFYDSLDFLRKYGNSVHKKFKTKQKKLAKAQSAKSEQSKDKDRSENKS